MSSCFHCAQAIEGVAYTSQLDGSDRQFCCPGCRAVYECIHQSGLQQYYRRRTEIAEQADASPEDYSSFDELIDELPFVRRVQQEYEARLLVHGLHCSACAWLIESALRRLEGVASVVVNLQQQTAIIRWVEPARLSSLMSTIQSLGYGVEPWTERNQQRQYQENRQYLQRRLGIAGLLMMQVGMLSIGLYAGEFQGMDVVTRDLLRWASLVLASLSLLYCATPFFSNAALVMRQGSVNMDVPVSLALLAAYSYSVIALLFTLEHVYFDTVTMFVFFLLLSRFLELLSRKPQQLERQCAQPLMVCRRGPGGEPENVLAQRVAVGDIVLSKNAAAVPLDGIIVEGSSRFDEAAFSGESQPLSKSPGDIALAGAINLDDAVWLEVVRPAAESSLARVEALTERAAASKPAYAQLIDRISPWFISAVLLAATVSFLLWWSHSPETALMTAIAVLVITCPCALALATPVALALAHRRARAMGVVANSGQLLQQLMSVTDVVFDKTGTLTENSSAVTVSTYGGLSREEALQLAASMEVQANHPFAQTITVANNRPLLAVENAREYPGKGVEAIVDGVCYRLGESSWCAALAGLDPVSLSDDGALLCNEQGVLAHFNSEESLLADAVESLARLASRGLNLHLLSGDSAARVTVVAEQLGIADYRARQTPEDKLRAVEGLQKAGRSVLMVGDGVNDAPVLAAADVSLAVSNAADLTKARADGLLLNQRLQSISELITLASQTRRVVRQNIAWAITYNAIGVPLAALAMVPPWLAAIGMSLSSLVVILNSRRLSGMASNRELGASNLFSKSERNPKSAAVPAAVQ